jgi:hypothetical protein
MRGRPPSVRGGGNAVSAASGAATPGAAAATAAVESSPALACRRVTMTLTPSSRQIELRNRVEIAYLTINLLPA